MKKPSDAAPVGACILTDDNMHTADDCTAHAHEAPDGPYGLEPQPVAHLDTVPTERIMSGRAVRKSSSQAYDDADPLPRMVVCAACRAEDGRVAVGARHFDQHIRAQAKAYGTLEEWYRAEQGFIDQRGEFMTRTEAWKVANTAGQIQRRCGGDTKDGGTLFSENLY